MLKKLVTFSREKSRKNTKIIEIAKEYIADEFKTDLFILVLFIFQLVTKMPVEIDIFIRLLIMIKIKSLLENSAELESSLIRNVYQ
jgi:hypothetical protein